MKKAHLRFEQSAVDAFAEHNAKHGFRPHLIHGYAEASNGTSGWRSLLPQLERQFGSKEREHFAAIFLDKDCLPLTFETLAVGTKESVMPPHREIHRRICELGARHVICIHNHPNGDPTPSYPDILATKELAHTCDLAGSELTDHLVVSTRGIASIRQMMAGQRVGELKLQGLNPEATRSSYQRAAAWPR